MNLLLAGLTWRSCLVYLDDILIFSPTFERHLDDMREGFQRDSCIRNAVEAFEMLLRTEYCAVYGTFGHTGRDTPRPCKGATDSQISDLGM